MPLPEGWTDDLSLRVAPGRTLDELVDAVLDARAKNTPYAEVLKRLTGRFALAYDDARVAFDRVGGGTTRAETQSEQNRPDATKDPVAFIAYQRARGHAAPPVRPETSPAWDAWVESLRSPQNIRDAYENAGVTHGSEVLFPEEREAAAWWRLALDAKGGARALSSARVAHRVRQLVTVTLESTPEANAEARTGLLVQVGAALSGLIENVIDSLGAQRYAPAGTDAWFDAIALADESRALADLFARFGDGENEDRSLGLRGRITTRALGHCYERVGAVMLASAACAQRLGDATRAVGYCDSMIGDFARVVVDPWEAAEEVPVAEDVVALRQLLEAIALRREITGAESPETTALRQRCTSLLARGT